MKLLHCGDIHLDSPLLGVLDSEKRRTELLLSFCDAVEYAANHDFFAVLIAGDLFDGDFTKLSTVNSVLSLIESNKKLHFFVLCGNHGGTKTYDILKNAGLKNLHFFPQNKFQTYVFNDVAVSGVELQGTDQQKYDTLELPPDKFNIVLLHGDTGNPAYGLIDQKALAKKGCDYLALGHLHSFQESKVGKMSVVYCGALECRGFDELSQSGFVVIDTESKKHKFVSQSRRVVETIEVDVSSVKSNVELLQNVKSATSFVKRSNYLNLILKGVQSEGVSVDFLTDSFFGDYFALRVENKTTLGFDVEKLKNENSLKGEFVKLALEIEDEKIKNQVLALGLLALSKEELAN